MACLLFEFMHRQTKTCSKLFKWNLLKVKQEILKFRTLMNWCLFFFIKNKLIRNNEKTVVQKVSWRTYVVEFVFSESACRKNAAFLRNDLHHACFPQNILKVLEKRFPITP